MIYREGEVRYLTGLISQSKSVRFRPYATKNKHRGIEQLAARVAHNHKVGGSSPSPATGHFFVFRYIYMYNEIQRR